MPAWLEYANGHGSNLEETRKRPGMKLPNNPTWLRLAMVVILVGWNTPRLSGQITDDQVRESLQAGVRYLLSKQQDDGSWVSEHARYPTGVTSLCTLALLNAGMTAKDEEIARALAYLRRHTELQHTYTRSLQTIVLCTAGSKKDLDHVQRNVAWLRDAQRKGSAGDNAGSWSYGKSNPPSEDPSNAQFALLALYEAERFGVPVRDDTWRLAQDYWKRRQRADGSFSYRNDPKDPSTGSMTCAGIGSLIITAGQVGELDAVIKDGSVQCCQSNEASESIEKAFEWLGKHFSVRRNPTSRRLDGLPGMYHYYYLYALERVGRLAGRRFIGDHDWYREGAEALLELQDPLSGYWKAGPEELTCTAFAVLFLSKGRRPVLLSKLKRSPANDWNRHRHDVGHLTHYVEKKWEQDLTWQVVDLGAATADDLLQSPVLFLTGRDSLELSDAEKESLRTYVESGGFLFAENCGGETGCEGGDFDRDFRDLMEELFPDSKLTLLPPDHAIWFAEEPIDPDHLPPLEGIEACCRTGVVYCPANLSCYWELAKPRAKQTEIPDPIAERISAALAIGVNVMTYAHRA